MILIKNSDSYTPQDKVVIIASEVRQLMRATDA